MLNPELLKKATILKLALRTQGVNVQCKINGVGENIKEDILGLYKIDKVLGSKPNELNLTEHITTKLIYNPQSPFKLIRENKKYWVIKNNIPLIEVTFNRRPSFYKEYTTKGTPMKFIGQVMGKDCLAIAVDKQCFYFKTGDFCKYCNCTPTNLESRIDRVLDLQDIEETVSRFGKEYHFFDLTGGTFEDRDEECRRYIEIGNILKRSLGKPNFSGPFSLSPPNNLSLLEDLYETGVDVISLNPDVWDDHAFAEICPGKNKVGKKHYDEALKVIKFLWGRGNAVVQFLIGPWESNESLLNGVRYHLERDILVNLTTFCPSPGSSLSKTKSKSLGELLEIYIKYGELIHEYSFYPNKRKSILTSESSNRSSISNEVAKKYLTRENYNPDIDLNFSRWKI